MLKNKNVVVTGGATGIGLGIAQAMAAAGAKVVIGGRRADAIEDALKTFSASDHVLGHVLDVADRHSVQTFFDFTCNRHGQVDILVQAAGVNIRDRTMAAMDPTEWDRVVAINVTGAYNCMHAVLPGMRNRRDGLIINISSIAGKRAIALGGIAYCASKFAMTALGTAASNEVAADGVRITNVYPGEVNTPLLDKRPTPVADEHRQKILQPEDVAQIMVAIAALPPRAHVPEIVIKPLSQVWF